MKSSSSMTFLMSFLLFIYFVSSSNSIHSSCHKAAHSSPTVNLSFCVATLEALPKTKNASHEELAVISIELSISSAKNISSHIAQLLEEGNLDYDALQDCSRLYSDAKSALQEAIHHIKQKDYQSANVKVSSVLAASTTCEDGFMEKKGMSSIAKENKQFSLLSAMDLAFTNVKH